MFITREMDYAVRVVRGLDQKGRCSAAELCEAEKIPSAFAYKVLKKLAQNGIVSITRGKDGGYRLIVPSEELTLYDIVTAMDDDGVRFTDCLDPDFRCTARGGRHCGVHCEMMRIQKVLEDELRRKSLKALFD